MPVLSYLGRVQIPLRRTPYDLPTYNPNILYGFDPQSYLPAMRTTLAQLNGPPATLDRVALVVPRISGLAQVTVNPNNADLNNNSGVGFAGQGFGWFRNMGDGNTHLQQVDVNTHPGIIGPAGLLLSLAPGLGTFIGKPFPMLGAGASYVPAIMFGLGSPYNIYYRYSNGGFITDVNGWRTGTGVDGWNTSQFFSGGGQSIISMSRADGVNFGFVPGNGNHPSMAFHWTNEIYNIVLPPVFPFTDPAGMTPDFSAVPSIQTAFVANAFEPSVFRGGFMFMFHTLGTGPNGTPYELAITNPEMTQFSLAEFIAVDGDAQTALARTGLGIAWTAKIDMDGTVYWHSGDPADVGRMFFSFVPINYQLPRLLYTPQPPVTLPCYNPCWPISSNEFTGR